MHVHQAWAPAHGPDICTLQMAMETPNMDPAAKKTIVLRWIDVGTTIVFWVEVRQR